MIDPKLLRSSPDEVARNLARRGYTLDVQALNALEEKRRHWQLESDRLRAERNAHAKATGQAKGRGEDLAPLMARGEALAREVEDADRALEAIQAELSDWQLGLPNLLHESVPDGRDDGCQRGGATLGRSDHAGVRGARPRRRRRGAWWARFRGREPDFRRALHCHARRARAAAPRAGAVHARPARRRARLHRGLRAVPGVGGGAAGHGPAAEVRAGPVRACAASRIST